MPPTLSEAPPLISQDVQDASQGAGNTQSASIVDAKREEQYHCGWQKLIDERLLKWLADPSQLEDEGIEAPDGTILRLAIDLAEKYRDDKLPPPDSLVPDPDGGIVFELQHDDISEVIHIWDDGQVEYQRFEGSKLAARCSM